MSDIKKTKKDLKEVKEVKEVQEVKGAQEVPEKAKDNPQDQYAKVYDAYKELTGAFPNKEWSFEDLVQEYEKAKERIAALAEQETESKEPKQNDVDPVLAKFNHNPDTHVLVVNERGQVQQITKVHYKLVKSSGAVKLYAPNLPELNK